jgi:hypothetical protein
MAARNPIVRVARGVISGTEIHPLGNTDMEAYEVDYILVIIRSPAGILPSDSHRWVSVDHLGVMGDIRLQDIGFEGTDIGINLAVDT